LVRAGSLPRPNHDPGKSRTTNPKNAKTAANNKPNAPAKIAVSDANHHTLFVRHVHTPKTNRCDGGDVEEQI
jgi:hypothetical protein